MEEYWYFLLLAILPTIIPSEQIDKSMKQRFPDDRKRSKVYLGFLFTMSAFFSMIFFLITDYLPFYLRIFASAVPLAGVGLGLLIAKYFRKSK